MTYLLIFAARAAAIVLLTIASFATAHAAPRLMVDNASPTAGFYQLSWRNAKGKVLLQEAGDPQFTAPRKIYQGSDQATMMSGKPDGAYYYRIRELGPAAPSAWSKTVVVTVKHHALGRALAFFLLGLIVFLATVILVFAPQFAPQTAPKGDSNEA